MARPRTEVVVLAGYDGGVWRHRHDNRINTLTVRSRRRVPVVRVLRLERHPLNGLFLVVQQVSWGSEIKQPMRLVLVELRLARQVQVVVQIVGAVGEDERAVNVDPALVGGWLPSYNLVCSNMTLATGP